MEYKLGDVFKYSKDGNPNNEAVTLELIAPSFKSKSFKYRLQKYLQSAQFAVRDKLNPGDNQSESTTRDQSEPNEKEKGLAMLMILDLDDAFDKDKFLLWFYKEATKHSLIMIDESVALLNSDVHLEQLFNSGDFEALAGAYMSNFIDL